MKRQPSTDLDALAALGEAYNTHKVEAELARVHLRKAVLQHLAAGVPELRVANTAGIDRTTVRKWRAQYELEKV